MKSIIDAAFRQEVEFLKALVRVPSDNPPGDCAPVAEVAARLMEELGFSVERHPVPEPFVHLHGMSTVTNLVVRHRFGDGGPIVALNAHGDVVPPGNGWTAEPYGGEERAGAVYGRGAAVSKSDFATYVFGLKALIASGDALSGAVELHFTFDEEIGGALGPAFLLEQGLSKPDYAICAGFSYAIVTAHNGALHMEVVVRGRQAHAALPETGVDAIEHAVPILAALYEERRRLGDRMSAQKGIGSPKLTVGLISGGINTNVVPDRVSLRLDRRLIPEEDGAEVEARLVDLVEAATPKVKGLEVECRRVMLAEPLRELPGAVRLASILGGHASALLGVPVGATGSPLYTDARHYAAAGVPAVLYGAGPRTILEANANAADEHVKLYDLRAATEVVALTLRDLLAK